MLRANLSKRESSICAFCQHRLSLRAATSPNRRQLSGTRSLRNDDGWGSWGGAWGDQSKAPAQPKQDDFADPHELIARKRLLEKQQEQARLDEQTRQARQAEQAQQTRRARNAQQDQRAPQFLNFRTTPASLQPRFVWNVEKQQAVEQSLRRDSTAFRSFNKDIISSNEIIKGPDISPFRRKSEEPDDAASESNTIKRAADISNPSRNGDLNSADRPRSHPEYGTKSWGLSQGPGVATRVRMRKTYSNNDIQPATPTADNPKFSSQPLQFRQPPPVRPPPPPQPVWPSQLFKPPQPPQVPQPSQSSQLLEFLRTPPPSKPPQPSQLSKITGEPGWGMLARKLTPTKSDSENFWAVFNKNAKPQDTKPGAPDASAESSGQSKSKDPWAAMLGLGEGSEQKNLYDWGKKLDKENDEEAKRQLSAVKEKSQEPERASSPGAPAIEQGSKGRDRGRDRDRRASRFEIEEDGVNDREKRSRRGKRSNNYDNEAFEFEDYQERRRKKAQLKAQREAERTGPIPILIPELINIRALAEALKVEPNLFLTQLGELGFEEVSLDSLMAGETAALVAQEYGFEPTVEAGAELDLKPRPPPEDPTTLPLRPPVVTIMGHVDHGKTTLLDYLRKSSIAAQEHGGITQRIGAFSVKLSSGNPITFLDTPGHAAFLTMRQRGAYVTDIVVLVVAADDSVKPQTIEAIKHARAAKVPMIVAINKIDKEGARIDQVKHDLAQEGVELEDYGGDVQVVCVSGKTGQGMEDLEENILTLSEILDHRAEIDGPAEGWILESSLKPIGKAATVLVKRGTMRTGDYIAAGLTWAKIRHIRNEAGVEIAEALPGTPVEILGWRDLPAAGDQVIQGSDEKRVKNAVEYREGLREREKDAAAHEEISEARKLLQEKRARAKEMEEAGMSDEALPEEENGAKIVNFVVKGDLHGSVEAVEASILELGNHEVRPRILRSGTGPIHEFDVEHAAMSKSIIVNFATTTPGYIKQMAEEQGVTIMDHTVIYHVVDDVKAVLSKHLAPEITSEVLGEAEVLEIFPINIERRKYKNVAGCRVRNGTMAKGNPFRVLRGKDIIFDGNLETLKHLKKDVTEVNKGTECGIGFEDFQDFEVGDQIQAYKRIETARSF